MRIVIADDSALLREGLTRLLAEFGHEIVGLADDAEEFLVVVGAQRPDLAIVDIRMPPTFTDDGLNAAVAARALYPELSVLVLSQYVEAAYAEDLFADGRGGVGYLLKDRVEDLGAFESAIQAVANGGTVLDPQVVAEMLKAGRKTDPLSLLTAREREVLSLMAMGRSNAAIAAGLFVTEGAVMKHIRSIFTKLDLPQSDGDHRRVLAVLAWLQA